MEKNQDNLSNYVFGKVQPQAIPLEEAVLGALMLDREAIESIIDTLTPESFYLDAHQNIYRAIVDLFNQSNPVDLLTVTEQLRKGGTLEKSGGPYYLVELSNRVASAANIEYHARIIQQKWMQRKLIDAGGVILQDGYSDEKDIFEMIDDAERAIFSITSGASKKDAKGAYEIAMSVLKNTEKATEKRKEGKITGVPSGLTEIDLTTGGFQNSDLIILAARPGQGKCLGKGTKVFMFDGSLKNVEDIVVGDLLMGDDSKPRKVLSLATGFEEMYFVRQNKGIDYRVNKSHILSLKRSRNENRKNHGEVVNVEVSEWLNWSKKRKGNFKGYKCAVNFPEKILPIEPYFLGLWIGDGTTKNVCITNPDTEIENYLKGYAERLGLELNVFKAKDKCKSLSITKGRKGAGYSLQGQMRDMGLIGNKFIPSEYFANSEENRLQLLAGLLDSDGYLQPDKSGFEITQTKESLAKQIKLLSDSLGFRTSIAKKRAKIKSTGFECDVYRMNIYGDIHRIPTRIKRKIAPCVDRRVDCTMTGVKVEFDKVDQYFGFEIDGNRLFLLEDMTVTHNTGLALTIANNAAKQGFPVGIFSFEMSETQLMARLIGGESGVSSNRMQNGDVKDFEWQSLQSAIEKIENLKLFIDDTAALPLMILRAKARRMKMKHGIQLLIIDYLQLMKSSLKGGTTNDHVSDISQGLKALAKDLDIPVIALSQLSRAVETRGGAKRPQLSDLRDSGSIEQDADIVGFIYRPEYYGILEDENGQSLKGVAEIIFAKHRNGPTGTVEVKFEEQFARFSDLIESAASAKPPQAPKGPTVPVYNPAESIRANRGDDPPF